MPEKIVPFMEARRDVGGDFHRMKHSIGERTAAALTRRAERMERSVLESVLE